MQPDKDKPSYRRMRGFEQASGLLTGRIRTVAETRGFNVSRLLTHWEEVVGAETAAICRPVKVGYGRGGLGATLTVLTTGAQAPMLQAQLPVIKDRVNACYGYAAISRIQITQTAPIGFAEGRAQFTHAPKAAKPAPAPEVEKAAKALTDGVQDQSLRTALESLGSNVLSKGTPRK